MAKSDAELANPTMTAEERLARLIARGEGHNDHEGMMWERYLYTARLILKHARIVFEKILKGPPKPPSGIDCCDPQLLIDAADRLGALEAEVRRLFTAWSDQVVEIDALKRAAQNR